jgi:hypothetical protein
MNYTDKWYDGLPSPWDADCRGKFCILETTYDLDVYNKTNFEARKDFFNHLFYLLRESGKLEWLEQNEIELNRLKVATLVDMPCYQLRVIIVVDLPDSLRTMYALRFR